MDRGAWQATVYGVSKGWTELSDLTTKRCSTVQFSCSVLSNSLQAYRLHHASPPCPSPIPRVYSNSCPLSQWCYPTIFCPLLLPPSIFPSNRLLSNESLLCIRWPNYWSFSINLYNAYSGLICFRIDWLDLLAVHGALKSLLQLPNSEALILRKFSLLHGPTITSVHDYWKNHSFD